MQVFKYILSMIGVSALIAGCGGVSNNVSFTVNPGFCADGTSNAPYCAQVVIQNNSGGQNFINSSNFPIQNLTFSATGPSNINYPVTTGSSMDPNGCMNSTVGPGGSCTFYLQLTGESQPVGPKVPITITANYTINNTLFGGSSNSASSSFTVYEYPAVVLSGTSGMAQNYSNNKINSAYNAESGSATVNANGQDSYYGFLYLITQTGGTLLASGTESFSYNMSNESSTPLSNLNNVISLGSTLYTFGNNASLYSSAVNPVSKIVWTTLYNSSISLIPNVYAVGSSNIYITTGSFVYICSINSGTGAGCTQEGLITPNGSISTLAFSSLGNGFTGLVIGANGGLYAESGTANSSTNAWTAVTVGGVPLTNPIVKIVADNTQDLYIADSSNNIYLMTPNSGNTATKLTTLSGVGSIGGMVYDNAANKLYVGSANALYSCGFENTSVFACSYVTSTSIPNVLGMNIITSLLAN